MSDDSSSDHRKASRKRGFFVAICGDWHIVGLTDFVYTMCLMTPIRRLVRKIDTIDMELRRAFVVLVLMLIVGTCVYAFAEGWSVLDAMYFSVITLTTIGYGDMHPTTQFAKVFTMGYVLIGVGLVFYIFTSLTRHFFEDEKRDILRIEHEIIELEALLKKKNLETPKK